MCSDVCAAERQLGGWDIRAGGVASVRMSCDCNLYPLTLDSRLPTPVSLLWSNQTKPPTAGFLESAQHLFGGQWWSGSSTVSNWGGVTAKGEWNGNCNWCPGYWWHLLDLKWFAFLEPLCFLWWDILHLCLDINLQFPYAINKANSESIMIFISLNKRKFVKSLYILYFTCKIHLSYSLIAFHLL